MYGSATLRGQADNLLSFVGEVLGPNLRPRIEQRAELSGLWIKDVRSLPLWRLQRQQASAKLSMSVAPPCFSATT